MLDNLSKMRLSSKELDYIFVDSVEEELELEEDRDNDDNCYNYEKYEGGWD